MGILLVRICFCAFFSEKGESVKKRKGANEKQCMRLQENVVFFKSLWFFCGAATMSLRGSTLIRLPRYFLCMTHTIRHSAEVNIGFAVATTLGCDIGIVAGAQLCAQVFGADQQSGSDL